ncbi:MAG: sugar transferase [Acidobacteriia bacterium]|nr:sugar transferase [Terriglobia bacterium]
MCLKILRPIRYWNNLGKPKFINVLLGDMSVVGPRPHMIHHTDEYSRKIDNYMVRHLIKPGITGLAQVSGRNAISWEQKFELDVQYAENVSAGMDAKILWLTVLRVLGRKDISSEGHVTSPEFLGSDRDTASAGNREICSCP